MCHVCRAALGDYELGLAYMVISASQRDPGEYMLQLQQFAAAGPPEVQRHAVDVHLGRFDRALAHLMAAQPPRLIDSLQLARDKVRFLGVDREDELIEDLNAGIESSAVPPEHAVDLHLGRFDSGAVALLA